MADKIYPKGIGAFKPGSNAPSFILGTAIIDVNEFFLWLKGEGKQYITEYKGKKQLKLTVLQSDKTGVNFQVDTYKLVQTPLPSDEKTDNPF